MLVVISKAIELASIGVIYSDAGRGKSMTLRAAARIFPGSILLRIRHHTRSPAGLSLGLPDDRRAIVAAALNRVHLKYGAQVTMAKMPYALLFEASNRLLTPGQHAIQVERWIRGQHKIGRNTIYRFQRKRRIATDEAVSGLTLEEGNAAHLPSQRRKRSKRGRLALTLTGH
jgi:hypothetical protein